VCFSGQILEGRPFEAVLDNHRLCSSGTSDRGCSTGHDYGAKKRCPR
jgi:hypothetical protein